MSKHLYKYKLLKDLPMYPKGTVVIHEYEVLPSQYNSGTYATNGTWHTKEREHKIVAPQFLEALVKWCGATQRDDCKGWVEIL